MTTPRIAVIYEDRIRPDTTGVYCLRALRKLAHVFHVRPGEWDAVPVDVDLFVNIDDGLEYHLPRHFRPAAWWVIDTHLNLESNCQRAPLFDFVFAAQKNGSLALRQRTGMDVQWLPLACDPHIHRRHSVPNEFDICFVGHIVSQRRATYLERLRQHFERIFIGQRFFNEMSRTYSASHLVFNISILDDVNMRVFEALACGSLLITNDLTKNGLAELFQNEVHLATYNSEAELIDKAIFFLDNEALGKRIALKGADEAITKHTYLHRMQSLLDFVETNAVRENRFKTYVVREWSEKTSAAPVIGDIDRPQADHRLDCLVSIVIVVHNNLEITQRCIDSIFRHTPQSFELVLVDNASNDKTAEFLKSVSNSHVIRNSSNAGFPMAANQGIRAGQGDFSLLLNNDTIVTPGWLGRLMAHASADPRTGLVGPCSNCVSGQQQIPASYRDIHELNLFALERGERFDRQHLVTDRLIGFCLLIRRQVIDSIGLLDEQFGIGCFEDDDYCIRARTGGWQTVIALDAFVHHEGGATFRSTKVNYSELMKQNQNKFVQKWNGSKVEQPVAEKTRFAGKKYPSNDSESAGIMLARTPVELSLCMIVRNNESTIRAALESARPWVDEMVVVDTGSTDKTPTICRDLGAIVDFRAWRDDFSYARNESLKLATGKWIFWMDSDDTLSYACGLRLRLLSQQVHPVDLLGFVMQVHCPGNELEELDTTVVDHVKLIRRHPQIVFDGRIHEQVLPAIRKLGGRVAWTDIFVTHSGYDHSPASQCRKLERDLHLLQLELHDRPNHTFTLFNLGMTLLDASRFDEASDYLRKAIKTASSPDESHVRKAYALLVTSEARKGAWESAWNACHDGLGHFPIDTELRFRCALLLQEAGKLHEAIAVYHDLLTRTETRHFTSATLGMDGFKARHNLAILYEDVGDKANARLQWSKILEEHPNYGPAVAGLNKLG